MKKKNILFLLLLFACCFSLSIMTFSSIAYSEGENAVTIETNSEVVKGSSYYAYVYINSLMDVATLSISVHYDEDVIAIKNVYNSVSCSLYDNSQKDGEISFSYIFDGNGTESKTNLFYFRYQVLDNATSGISIFDITVNEAYDSALQVINVSGSRTSLDVIEKENVLTASVYGTSSISSKIEQEFELLYSFSTYKIASGSVQIQYDKELFEFVSLEQSAFLNGKIVDVNSKLDGSVYISFLGTEYSSNTSFCKVRFKTVGNEMCTSQIKCIVSELYDLQLNGIQCSGYTTNINLTYDSVYDDTLPKMYLSSTYDEDTNKVNLLVKLSANSHLGAGDFVIQWDNNYLDYSSFQKKLSTSFFNVNDKQIEDGILKFSIISLSDIMDGGDVLSVAFDIIKPHDSTESEIAISGSGLSDSLTNSIDINFVGCNQIIVGEHKFGDWTVVLLATCTQKGLEHRNCKFCDCEETRDLEIDPDNHDLVHHDAKAETCMAVGWGAYDTCSRCDYTTYEGIPALGHSWGEVKYVWSVDNSTCTATRVCSRDENHKETETVNTTSNVVQTKTCLLPELTTYTATFTNEAFETQVMENVTTSEALGHSWGEVKYIWSVDNSTCTATRVCLRDGNHKETETVNTTSNIVQNKTCVLPELTKYTATFTKEAFETQVNENIQTADALGHNWDTANIAWTWTEYSSAKARIDCARCDEYTELTAEITSEITLVPTCIAIGTKLYTAKIVFNEIEYTNTKEETLSIDPDNHDLVHHDAKAETCTDIGWGAYDTCSRCDYTTYSEIPALGHNWDTINIAWTWTEYSSAKARIDCARCDEYTELTAEISSEVILVPTCKAIGTRVYTAKIVFNETEYTDTKEETLSIDPDNHDLVHHDAQTETCIDIGWGAYDTCSRCDYTTYNEISALGHRWSEVQYIWSQDNSTCTATRVCLRDENHKETETVNTTSNIVQNKSCVLPELTTYTATFINEVFKSQVKENVKTSEELGHDLIHHKGTASCTSVGYDDYDTCSRCDYTTYEEIAAPGHKWGEVKYVWSVDNSTCTATRVCSRDENHKETETVNTTSNIVQNKTCILPELTTYTAVFTNEAFKTLEKENIQTAEALGHNWDTTNISWTWTGYSSAKARIDCTRCDEYTELTAEITSEVTLVPTCKATGTRVYTARVTFNETEYTDTKEEILSIDPDNHDLVHHDAQTETCTDIGWGAYDTCSRCDYTTYSEIPELGHSWDEVEYVWSADNSTCTATMVCLRDENHKETETVNTTANVVQNKTCVLPELTTYTAVFTNEAFGTKVKENVQTAEVIGHNWDTANIAWIWTGYSSTKARIDCTRCDEYEELTAEISFEVTLFPTCTATGTKLYTAKVVFNETEYTDTKEETLSIDPDNHDLVSHEAKDSTCTEIGWEAYDTCTRCEYTTYEEIPALGHSWGEVQYVWNQDNSTCTATRVCLRDENHKETETVNSTSNDVQTKTCVLPELTTYIATFTNEAFGIKVKENVQTAEALGHNLTHHNVKEETCTDIGWEAYDTCSRCDYTTYKEIPATGHDFGDWYVTKKPTYYESGEEKRVCRNNEAHAETRIIPVRTIDDSFEKLIGKISSAETTEGRFDAIRNAVVYYDSLDAETQEFLKNEYNVLIGKIQEYNVEVSVLNDEHADANENALMILASSLSCLAVLVFLLKRKFM